MGYRHTQIGNIIIGGTALGVVALLASISVTGTLRPVEGAILLLLAVVMGLFHSLTTEIEAGDLSCRFGPGIIRKRFPLSDIVEVRSVRNPWYAGWGIRWFPGRYMLWSVSGFRAVELVTRDGVRFRIGTDEPEMLVQAIRANTKRRGTRFQEQSLKRGI
jgi:hypothetical protein